MRDSLKSVIQCCKWLGLQLHHLCFLPHLSTWTALSNWLPFLNMWRLAHLRGRPPGSQSSVDQLRMNDDLWSGNEHQDC